GSETVRAPGGSLLMGRSSWRAPARRGHASAQGGRPGCAPAHGGRVGGRARPGHGAVRAGRPRLRAGRGSRDLGERGRVTPRGLGESGERLARALESLADAIELLQWRYEREADLSVARLEVLRDELRIALMLAECDARRLH